MSEIQFVEVDSQTIHSELISDFEAELNETLYPGDERRIFLDPETQVIVGLKNSINETGKQNLLRYAMGELLDELGEWSGTKRISAKKAATTFKFTLEVSRDVDTIIPFGTRCTPDGVIYFSTISDLIISAKSTEGIVNAEANEVGSKYNNFTQGQIKTLVDPIPFVKSVINIDTSSGGSDIESDEAYRDRIRQAPEAITTAGSEEAYKYWAKTADSNISDINILSPAPGTIKIVVLLNNGEIPSEEVINNVRSACSQKDRRPITDNVEVGAPTIKTYDISLTYYLDKEHETEVSKFRKAIEGDPLSKFQTGAVRDYINWQQEKLNREISIDELRFRIQNAALYMTSDNKQYTAVRRIEIISPNVTSVDENEVAKVGNITVNYGGLE